MNGVINIKIYLAGDCSTENRTTIVHIAEQLRRYHNLEVYCPWEFKVDNAWKITQEEWSRRVFEADVAAIRDCDFIVAISVGRISSAGVNWELGFAKGIGKKTIVIQITDAPTSLMVFCGATYFYNASKDTLYQTVGKIAENLSKYNGYIWYTGNSHYCETVLT